ncbi:MAG: hypothetical protein ACXW3Z_15460 [Limisphaerales bacterium]
MPDEPKIAPPPNEQPAGDSPAPQNPKKLTPEEQMALYEDALKETDWGHQPC